MKKTVLVTGVAGFIGFHLARRLLKEGHHVIGIDIVNDYYDPRLKESRLHVLTHPHFKLYRDALENKMAITRVFEKTQPHVVVNLAAQAGVRYSLENPDAYIQSNIVGFLNILEACRAYPVEQLIYASSSSVYGSNKAMPFSEQHPVDHPLSLYAASKKANELMAHTYSHLFGLKTTGLRFFSVYGPWGRPDMALYKFTEAIMNGEPIDVYNYGDMQRDFTYIDDIIESIVRLMDIEPLPEEEFDYEQPLPDRSDVPFRVYNIGNQQPVPLMDFIRTIEERVGKKAILKLLPLQAGDVPASFADSSSLYESIDFQPRTSIQEGVNAFIDWYIAYHQVLKEGIE
ncbi:NAD-dependent epimerase [Exiguobacterium qingdaonense]|uniref:NAD-dependent epimerase n=1 Tax=Exiguobacterium qingdaonense TaxID=2751251 RepID=UPI001BE7582B|nr:NAD-dependent epimerase [Exiguobacterium qingdaonense]